MAEEKRTPKLRRCLLAKKLRSEFTYTSWAVRGEKVDVWRLRWHRGKQAHDIAKWKFGSVKQVRVFIELLRKLGVTRIEDFLGVGRKALLHAYQEARRC